MLTFTAMTAGRMSWDGFQTRCVLGKGGVRPASDKREGDGASPLGAWPIRRALWRADRGPRPETDVPIEPILPDDGWCDAPDHPAYNTPVVHPFEASAERMWREDGLYDIVVVLGHNDDPVVPGAGSAIFLHCASPDWRPTEGCVAIAEGDLRALLAVAQVGDLVAIVEG
jgi:L,D-peptidoglycan transpeptidase YkuD (ErfK/YbiS/YcfS/YnhG family)